MNNIRGVVAQDDTYEVGKLLPQWFDYNTINWLLNNNAIEYTDEHARYRVTRKVRIHWPTAEVTVEILPPSPK